MSKAAIIVPIIGAIAVGGIVYAANKTAAAEDLAFGPERVEFNPLKDIYGGIATVSIIFSARNIRKSSLTLEAIDLTVKVGGRALATVREFGNPIRITGLSSTEVKLKAKAGIIQLGIALGSQILQAIGEAKDAPPADKQSILKRIMPKEVQLTGNLRAEGQVIAIDETIPLKV